MRRKASKIRSIWRELKHVPKTLHRRFTGVYKLGFSFKSMRFVAFSRVKKSLIDIVSV